MMSVHFDGLGATISSQLIPARPLISMKLSERARDYIAATNQLSGVQVKRPSGLIDPGQVVCEFDYLPTDQILDKRVHEWTITLPADGGTIVFLGWVMSSGGERFASAERLTTRVVIRVTAEDSIPNPPLAPVGVGYFVMSATITLSSPRVILMPPGIITGDYPALTQQGDPVPQYAVGSGG
jgi:hypothetical protein